MIIKCSSRSVRHGRILGADDDEQTYDDFDYNFDENSEDVSDTLDDVAETVEDIQDSIEEVDQDDVTIDADNNITDHYIAECDVCHGIFISAMVVSEQDVEKVTGVCPLCEKESDQYLKWVIKDVESIEEERTVPR